MDIEKLLAKSITLIKEICINENWRKRKISFKNLRREIEFVIIELYITLRKSQSIKTKKLGEMILNYYFTFRETFTKVKFKELKEIFENFFDFLHDFKNQDFFDEGIILIDDSDELLKNINKLKEIELIDFPLEGGPMKHI